VSVTIGGLDLENTFFNSKKRNIKGTSSEIENENITLLLVLFIKTISNSCCSRLVDDTKHIETRDGSSVLSSLSLRVVEIGRDGNYSRFDGSTKISLSDFLHLHEDHGRNLLSLELFSFTLVLDDNHRLIISSWLNFEWPKLDISLNGGVLKFTTDESLGIKNGVKRVSGGLILGRITYKTLVFSEGDV